MGVRKQGSNEDECLSFRTQLGRGCGYEERWSPFKSWIRITRATLVLINLIVVMELLLGDSSSPSNRTASLHERFNQCPTLSESNTLVMHTSTMDGLTSSSV